jgi:hypothetical protein
VVLRLLERRAERAAVLDRMRHVAQVRLGRVVHERGERILDVPAARFDQLGHDHRVLRDRVEDARVPAEPALVRERPRDVTGVELPGVGIERVHPPPGDGLQVGPGSGRSEISHADHGMSFV